MSDVAAAAATPLPHAAVISNPPALRLVEPVRERHLVEVAAEIVPAPRPWLGWTAKRGLDIVGSALGLLLLSPLFLVVAILVKATSRGPVLFAQPRCGLGGKPFKFYKFRTMVDGADQARAALLHLNEMSGPIFKIRRDPRITRIGAFLRKTSIDELPQLWNVLRGDMSLVGPRPPMLDEVVRYNARQAQRLAIVPGITGLWQVSGRSEISDFEQWLELDLEYARTWSLWLDLRILAKTVIVVASTKGAG